MTDTPAIEVKQLQFAYGNHRLFDNLSLRIPQRAITALIGPNGAGKSTLMHCLTGIFPPLSGDILLNGTSIYKNINAARRQMGYLPDNFGLYPELTVAQHLKFAATHSNAEAMKKTVSEMTLADLLNRKPTTLSRGQRQRLGIAMAIMHKPAVIFLDEPASGLDPTARMQLSELLTQLKNNNATLLVSSHILTELREYATHYIILNNGRIEDEGELAPTAVWRLRLHTADDTAAALARLQSDDAVADVQPHNNDTVFFTLTDAQAASEVLHRLITGNIAVAEFHQLTADIEKLYKQHIGQ